MADRIKCYAGWAVPVRIEDQIRSSAQERYPHNPRLDGAFSTGAMYGYIGRNDEAYVQTELGAAFGAGLEYGRSLQTAPQQPPEDSGLFRLMAGVNHREADLVRGGVSFIDDEDGFGRRIVRAVRA